MKLLTIYTANKNFISLRIDDKLVSCEIAKNTGEVLMAEIANLLETNNIKPKELDLIFVCRGVGSFTGLRVGLAIAKTLAQVNNVNIASFLNMDICTGVKAYAQGAYIKEKQQIIYVNADEVKNLKNIEWEDEINLVERVDKLAVEVLKQKKFENYKTLDCVYVEKSQAERELEKDLKKLEVKKVTSEDISKLLEIETVSFNYNVYTKENFSEFLSSTNKHMFKIIFRNEIAGYIVFQKVESEAELLKIAILPKHRGKGLAETLFKEAVRELKPKEIFLEVHKNNTAAINLYKKLKFNEIGKREKYYDDGGDAVIMKLII